jgi:uroporphyrinogen-III synthase
VTARALADALGDPARAILTPSTPGAAQLGAMISVGPVLALGAAHPRAELADALRAAGLELVTVACYETAPTVLTGFTREELRLADVIVIAAPSAWRVARADVRRGATVVVPGATTAAAVAKDHELVVAADGDLARTLADVVARLDQGIDRSGQ